MRKVGDKFIVEIGEICVPDCGMPAIVGDGELLYRIKGFKSLVFDEHGLRKLEKPLFGGVVDYQKAVDEISMDSYKEGYEAGFDAGVKAGNLAATGESYAQGLKEGCESGWEFAKKVSILPDEAKREIFGTEKGNTINMGYSYAEARQAVESYKLRPLKVGDEVEYNDGSHGIVVKTIVIDEGDRMYHVLWSDGNTGDYFMVDEIKPTGRHFPIEDLLRQMEGGNG